VTLALWDSGTGTTAWGRRNHLRRDGSNESLCGRELASGPDWLDLCARCEAIAHGLGFTTRECDATPV
jgi:hypothetical protein